MALTKVSTDGVKDDAITKTKIPANQIEASELADNAVDTNAIADQAVALSKLPHGDGSSDGKFLRANNGADPTFETVNTDLVADTSPQLGGDLDTNSNHILLNDTAQLKMGASNDFILRHNGTDNTLGGNATTKFFNPLLEIYKLDGTKKAAAFNPDGSTELYYNNAKKLETYAGGIRLNGVENAGSQLQIGASNDFAIEHDGSNTYLANNTGDLVLQNDAAVKITAKAGGTQRFRFDTDGLKFGTDTAAANALDDYEEGTWTPAISGVTYTDTQGHYVKIGTTCFVTLTLNGANTSKGNVDVRITGLPFTPKVDSGEFYPANSVPLFEVSSISLASGFNNMYLRIDDAQGNLQILVTDGESHGILTAGGGTTLNSGHVLRTSFTYLTAT